MGWLKLASQSAPPPAVSSVSGTFQKDLKATTQHVESISLSPATGNPTSSTTRSSAAASNRKYPFVSPTVPDTQLPFIPASEIRLRKQQASSPSHLHTRTDDTGDFQESLPDELWLVIDNIVYDCGAFASVHPGGEQVIDSFRGEECSWQFWRFHGKEQMEQFGRPLRVGTTVGMVNRFKERPRWVGLMGLGARDEW